MASSSDTIRELEKRFEAERVASNLVTLMRAYMDSREPRNLQKGLDLGLKNLDSFGSDSKFLRHLSEMFLYIQNDSTAQQHALDLAKRAVAISADAKGYVYLGYVYWSLSRHLDAIDATERALTMIPATDLGQRHEIGANLAYFLAEAGDKKYRERALTLAREAYAHDPRPSKADTFGYVLMRFSVRREELEQAEALFLEAEKSLKHENTFLRAHLEEVRRLLHKDATHHTASGNQ